MEDQLRPVPAGWVRQFYVKSQHQFFVDASSSPPGSTWNRCPYDDEQYLASLSPEDRATVMQNHQNATNPHRPSQADLDLAAEHASDEADTSTLITTDPPRRRRGGILARKLKDVLTRKSRAERSAAGNESETYRQNRILRGGAAEAINTAPGRPQLLVGNDENCTHIFVEPPGHTFPCVGEVKGFSACKCEVVYDDSQRPTGRPAGKHLRPDGEMYGHGDGGHGSGRFDRGRWDNSGEEYKPTRKRRGSGGGIGWRLVMPVLGGIAMGGLGGISHRASGWA
ncbi:hypothetical protein QBC42DRAFT_322307 [Cladorrhinum samala]|uniref:WW domain-containing protein n=1 Tax=Cladorrhinum samala TaxID=585594 RepID=A0AAV9H9H1_9PEZI|nr:hypothetical protein QBC42DRAFT_322307 [Cladorrhinum samala]